MISIENLKVEFGATPLFQGVSYIINPKDRIALVGKNGAGKSTLFRMILGEDTPDEGPCPSLGPALLRPSFRHSEIPEDPSGAPIDCPALTS